MEALYPFLFADWLSKPVWMWLAFVAIVIALIVVRYA